MFSGIINLTLFYFYLFINFISANYNENVFTFFREFSYYFKLHNSSFYTELKSYIKVGVIIHFAILYSIAYMFTIFFNVFSYVVKLHTINDLIFIKIIYHYPKLYFDYCE